MIYHSMRNFFLIPNFLSKKFSAHAFPRYRQETNFAWADLKIFICIESVIKFSFEWYAYHIYESFTWLRIWIWKNMSHSALRIAEVEIQKSTTLRQITFWWKFQCHKNFTGWWSLVAKISVVRFLLIFLIEGHAYALRGRKLIFVMYALFCPYFHIKSKKICFEHFY